jgi:hypothetical protein
MLFTHERRGVPEESRNPGKKLLQWPASLEIPRLPGLEDYFRVARKTPWIAASAQTGWTDVVNCRSERSGGST